LKIVIEVPDKCIEKEGYAIKALCRFYKYHFSCSLYNIPVDNPNNPPCNGMKPREEN
jgi:hypothetical protein